MNSSWQNRRTPQHMELKINTAGNGIDPESARLLDAALAYMFETSLGVRLEGLSCNWQVAEDSGPSICFAATASPYVAVQGTVLADKGVLKGFTGAYSTDSRNWEATAKPFRLKITPMSTPWILAAARDNRGIQLGGNPTPPPAAEFEFSDSLMERALAAYDETPSLPYEFRTTGQMDCIIASLVMCMEQTVIERMDSQDKFIDRIDLPDGVCPGATAVVLRSQPYDDALLVETHADGKPETLEFSRIGVDAAAAITRHVIEQYPKKPLLK